MLDLSKIYEALLYWRANLSAKEFAEAVGRTRQHLQKEVITPFIQKRGMDIEETRGKKHGRSLIIEPKISQPDLWDFFSLLDVERKWRRHERKGLSSLAEIDIIDIIPPESSETSFWVCRATAQKCTLFGNYLFKNHGVLNVQFSPHTLVRTPRRIHARGHLLVRSSEKKIDWGYLDLVPSRFLDDSNLRLGKSEYIGVEDDKEWHQYEKIAFRINPDLPKNAYLALQNEYDIKPNSDGYCIIYIEVRKALVYYYEHHVYSRMIGKNPMRAWVRCQAD
ncbi:MAG: hypothetical protein OXF20_06880 [Gammaproteobacteria bacterium]|nr:hypothetical protein [Gammaproteobacteria bacterium]